MHAIKLVRHTPRPSYFLSLILPLIALLITVTPFPLLSLNQTEARISVPVRLGPDSQFAGNLFFAESDIEIPCSLEMRPYLYRSYNSRSGRTGIFGKGWMADPADIRIKKRADGKMLAVMGDGHEELYELRGGNEYFAIREGETQGYRLTPSGELGHFLWLRNGERWDFNPQGYLVAKKDSVNNLISIERDRDGITPLSIEGSLGKKLIFRWKDEKITAIEGTAGLRVDYHYDKQGRLAAKTNALAQKTLYNYDKTGFVSKVDIPGGPSHEFTFSNGLLSGYKSKDGTALTYRYHNLGAPSDYRQEVLNEPGKLLWATEIRRSGAERVVVDRQQNRTIMKFDAEGRLTSYQGPVTKEERWHYNDDNILEFYEDGLGSRTTYEWSKDGLKLIVTLPRGARAVFEYDLSGLLVTETDLWGATKKYVRDQKGRITKILYEGKQVLEQHYNEQGYLDSVEGVGDSWKIERDALGNITKVTDGEGRVWSRQSNVMGQPVSQTDGEDRTTTWSYDQYGRLAALTDGAGNRKSFVLSSVGYLRAFTDANGNQYKYRYRKGIPVSLTFPNGTSESIELDLFDRIAKETNHRDETTEYDYDVFGRIVRQTFPGGFNAWEYNQLGQLIRAFNAHSAYEIKYDRYGETSEIRDGKGRTLQYEYNEKGQRTALVDPEGKRTIYEYDLRGNLSKITGPQGEVYRYEYDVAGRLVQREYPNGIGCRFIYDRGGQLSYILYNDRNRKTFYTTSIVRDKSGRIVSRQENALVWRYVYDQAGRLTQVRDPERYEESFTYDGAGNRIAHQTPAGSKRLQYGQMNEMLSDGNLSYAYDPEGQPLSRSDGVGYEFNPLGQLVGLKIGGEHIRYDYDPFGRLVAREKEGKRTEYFYDKEDIIAEYGSGVSPTRYVHGPDIDEPLSFWKEGEIHILLSGLNNSVRRVYAKDGSLIEDYAMKAFGEVSRPERTPVSRYLFNSREWDPDAKLYHVRARFYDPATGRFVNPDPIRFRGGWNLYAYAGNDPLNSADLFGLERKFAGGHTLTVFGGKLIGFKTSVSHMYFGPNDPRNGIYISAGGGLDYGESAGFSSTVSQTVSDDPYKSYEGPSVSFDYSMGKPLWGPAGGGSVSRSLEKDPWVTYPDWNIVQAPGDWFTPTSRIPVIKVTPNPQGPPDLGLGIPGSGTLTPKPKPWERLLSGKAIGINYTVTKQVYAWNQRHEVVSTEVSPSHAKVNVKQNQKFTFKIQVGPPPEGPFHTKIISDHDVTDYAKWYYAEDVIPVKYVETRNPFVCEKKGKFLIWAHYINDYVFNPKEPLHTGADGSATVECIEEEAAPVAKDNISFTQKTYDVREDAGYANIKVKREGSGKGQVIAQIHVQDGTAKVGKDPGEGDYDRPGIDRVIWEDKDRAEKSIAIKINKDDLVEGTEDVKLKIEINVGHAQPDPISEAILQIKDVLPSGIELTKTPSTSQIADGDEVTFTFEVTNTGKSRLKNLKLSDPSCPGKLVLKSGDRNGDNILDPDEKWTYECTITLQGTGLFTNEAKVEALDEEREVVEDDASAQVAVGHKPNIVPNVIGMTEDEAVKAISDAGLTPNKAGNRASDLAVGLVCEQNPEADQTASHGQRVSFWITANVPKYLYLDPPRKTLPLGEQVSFEVTLINKDGSQRKPSRGDLTWDPGPSNSFKCEKAGKFIVWAKYIFAEAYGSATVTCEEDWSVPAFEPPITNSTDRNAKLPQATPADYTWYAICDPRSGEVTYGQQLLTGRKLMAGPFVGPRTVNDWIQKNCPRWRCDTSGLCATAPVLGGEWKVLCGKSDLKIHVGKIYDVTKFILVREGFLGEPDARAWANQNYPNWACTQAGAPVTQAAVTKPRMGGRWAVVCNRNHGGVGLTEYPDPTRDWILGQGFFGEPDARLWTEQNCPSWRCDANGQCLKGVGRRTPEGTPPEVPSDTDSLLGEHWDPSDNHPQPKSEPSTPAKETASAKTSAGKMSPKQEYLSDAEVKAFQDEIWNKYYEKWKKEWCVTREEKKINAGKPGRVNYSGCAIEPHAKLGGLVGSAGRARTREQQNVVRSLAVCTDACMMNDTSPQVRESCLQNCIKTHPMPK